MSVTKDRTERIKLIRQKTGDRLKEVLRDRCSQAALLRKTAEKYGEAYSMLPSHLSEIINYKRTLPREFAAKFADVLNVDAGYLLGVDDFKAADYSEFLRMQKHKEEAERSFSEYGRINLLLLHTGYTLESMAEWDNKILSYDIKVKEDDDTVVTIPAAEMERTINDINRYIKMQIDYLIESHKEV